MTGIELVLGGAVALAVLPVIVRARTRRHRTQLAAEIARVGTSPVSLAGRVLVTAVLIASVQWLIVTHVTDQRWVWVALAGPALVTAFTLVRALTVTEIRGSRGGGGRR